MHFLAEVSAVEISTAGPSIRWREEYGDSQKALSAKWRLRMYLLVEGSAVDRQEGPAAAGERNGVTLEKP